MKRKCFDWYLRCSNCGFDFSVLFDVDETEENKETLKRCPCGCKMTIAEEKEIELDIEN